MTTSCNKRSMFGASYAVIITILLCLSTTRFCRAFHAITGRDTPASCVSRPLWIARPCLVFGRHSQHNFLFTGEADLPRPTSSLFMSGQSSTAMVRNENDDVKKGFVERIKSLLPPAKENEKVIPLALMFFCILFNYTILRGTKDVLMITAPNSGAEGACV